MRRTNGHVLVSFSLASALAACAEAPPATDTVDGPAVTVAVAALSLDGVADAAWDLRIANASGDTVIARRVTASQYGDGIGSVSYVAPCDASDNDNVVTVRLVGLYAATLATPGAFGDPAPAGALVATDPGLLSRTIECLPNADAAVRFDVTIMRPAQQGFFDVAVDFEDTFCSAKLDCEAGALLHDGNGDRQATHVLGFACTSGAGSPTRLHLDDIIITCGDDQAVIDPSAGEGNLCDAGDTASCAPAVDDPAGILFQAAVYQGTEGLPGLDKHYWNVAFGLAAGVTGCRIEARGTADDGVLGEPAAIVAPRIYPFIQWDVSPAECAAAPEGNVALGLPGVMTAYANTGAVGSPTFAHSYPVPSAPELPTQLVLSQVTDYNAAVLFLDRVNAILCEDDFMMGGVDCRFLYSADEIYVDLKYGYDVPSFRSADECHEGYPTAVGYNFKFVNSDNGNTAAWECHTKAFQAMGQLFFTADEKEALHAWAVANGRYDARSTATILDLDF